MLNELEIRKEIARLEYEEASYPNYEKLAALYVIRGEMKRPVRETERTTPQASRSYSTSLASATPRTVGSYGESEFLKAVEGTPPAEAWEVMDELMTSLRVIRPRTYDAVLDKIKSR